MVALLKWLHLANMADISMKWPSKKFQKIPKINDICLPRNMTQNGLNRPKKKLCDLIKSC